MDLDKLLARRLPDPLLRLAVRLILNRKTKQQSIDDIEEHQAFLYRRHYAQQRPFTLFS